MLQSSNQSFVWTCKPSGEGGICKFVLHLLQTERAGDKLTKMLLTILLSDNTFHPGNIHTSDTDN